MRTDNEKSKKISTELKGIQNLIGGYFHPSEGTLVLPQTSVPACLASKALWASFISWSFGPQTSVSNSAHAIVGAAAGLIFGGNSLYGAVSGTNNLLKEINTNIAHILSAVESNKLPTTAIDKLDKQIEGIPKKPQTLSWSQIVNVAFAWYTATITSFTYAGAVRDAVKSEPCLPNKPCSDTYPAFPLAAAFAVLWGMCALFLAYYGQREQAFLTQLNNKLKGLIANNPELSAAINESLGSVAVTVSSTGIDNSIFTPRNDEQRTDEQTPLLLSSQRNGNGNGIN